MSVAKDPFESYLQRAAELFESGDVVKAGQIWQAILKKQPGHEAARTGLYKVKVYFDARATQDGLTHSKPLLPVAPVAPAVSSEFSDPQVPRLLEEGCTLYDAGQVESAIEKWEKVLGMEPENALAKGYINGAKRVQVQDPEGGGLDPSLNSIRDTSDFAQDIPLSILGSPKIEEPPPVVEVPKPLMEVAAPVAQPPVPAAPPAPEVDVEQLLRDGCTLYDMGQVEDALKKWERALTAAPGHALARAYIKDARKDLGLPALEEGAIPEPPAAEASAPAASASVAPDDERLEQLLREGVQLYDMGMAQEASVKWQQILEASPDHRDAKTYLAMAERDLQAPQAPTRSAAPAPVKAAEPKMPQVQPASSWTQSPSFAPMEAISLDTFEPKEAAPEPEPSTVAPPKALTAPAASTVRKGLVLPPALQGVALPAWLNSPVFILGGIVGLVVLIVGSTLYHRWSKDVELRNSVATLSAQALQPVARSAQIISLDETPESLKSEAEQALREDPLVAYYRAQELVRLSPGDASGAELLERTKEAMANAATSPAPTLADYDRQRQDGDLDSANRSITQLLLLAPDDASLKERAVRLFSALSQLDATKESWKEAEECLRRGRAIAPSDKTWSARLKLLEHIKQMSKNDRLQWVQLLG